jgi:hypothetical protein
MISLSLIGEKSKKKLEKLKTKVEKQGCLKEKDNKKGY